VKFVKKINNKFGGLKYYPYICYINLKLKTMVVFLILLGLAFSWLHQSENDDDDNLSDEAWNEKYNR
jgi:hypothetical protein